jgi:hypothetical protein
MYKSTLLSVHLLKGAHHVACNVSLQAYSAANESDLAAVWRLPYLPSKYLVVVISLPGSRGKAAQPINIAKDSNVNNAHILEVWFYKRLHTLH